MRSIKQQQEVARMASERGREKAKSTTRKEKGKKASKVTRKFMTIVLTSKLRVQTEGWRMQTKSPKETQGGGGRKRKRERERETCNTRKESTCKGYREKA